MCVYSTTLFRAAEVLKGAKRYIHWTVQTRDDGPTIVGDNEYTFTVKTMYGNTHSIRARPKTPNSCRGDAPAAAIFDEIAFVTA